MSERRRAVGTLSDSEGLSPSTPDGHRTRSCRTGVSRLHKRPRSLFPPVFPPPSSPSPFLSPFLSSFILMSAGLTSSVKVGGPISPA